MRRFSGNLGASTSWNSEGLSRPVMVLLLLFIKEFKISITANNTTEQLQTPCRWIMDYFT
jgi:hypothetical protein